MGDKENFGWEEGAVTSLPSRSAISLSFSRTVRVLRNILVAPLCFDLLGTSTCAMNDNRTALSFKSQNIVKYYPATEKNNWVPT